MKKNIIVLVTDTFRYDNLFNNAERPVRTPCLDRFCESTATNVTNFYTASFPTIPNRTDLATGIFGWPHYGWQPIDQSGPNHIGKTLHRQGYKTQLICDCPHLFNSRFQFGFDAAYQHRGQEGDKHLLHLNHPIRNEMPFDKTRRMPIWNDSSLADAHRWINRYFEVEEETFMYKTAATTARWLEENYQWDPFFLWVDFFDPHEPWDPPEYMVKNYDPDYDGAPMIHCNYGPATDYSPAELHNLWAHYAAESELVDKQLGVVLQKIQELQLLENSIVIITSDHGTSIGEHNRTGKSNISDNDDRYWPIYPEVGHVPFIIAGPGVPQGKTTNFLAQPPDILPSLSELAGFELDVRQPVNGESFVGALQNGDSHRDLVVSAGYVSPRRDGRCPPNAVTPFVVDGQWGYTAVGSEGEPELYEYGNDPNAANDVISQNASAAKEMQQKFEDFMRSIGADDTLIQCWSPQ